MLIDIACMVLHNTNTYTPYVDRHCLYGVTSCKHTYTPYVGRSNLYVVTQHTHTLPMLVDIACMLLHTYTPYVGRPSL